MFKAILIANRGEIACRIAEACKKLEIRSVVLTEPADRFARHTRVADEVVEIDSYLDQEAVIAAAKSRDCDAIHPGYGFLSENAEFIDNVQQSGIVFIGPNSEAAKLAGDKIKAKEVADSLKIPTLPYLQFTADDLSGPESFIKDNGLPVLVKAAGGGGGRGIRLVQSKEELAEAVSSAAREAKALFKSEELFIEKALQRPKHIEVQIACDQHSNATHIFDRECSMQRRHQKIIEEAPTTTVDQKIREQILEQAVNFAKGISYLNLGTVEFLVEDSSYYFLEMNSRLQVEHPVTEAVTGLDLVATQIHIAAGKELSDLVPAPISEKQVAIEARVCAERPEDDYTASTGTLLSFEIEKSRNLRVDTGYMTGDRVSSMYDSLLAKIIATGDTRAEAIEALKSALKGCEIYGVETNVGHLLSILNDQAFLSGTHHTKTEVSFNYDLTEIGKIALAAGWLEAASPDSGAWSNNPGWSLAKVEPEPVDLLINGQPTAVSLREARKEPKKPHNLLSSRAALWITTDYGIFKVERPTSTRIGSSDSSDEQQNELFSPLPGKVIGLKVGVGDRVESSSTLLLIESMKMEHHIKAPGAATVSEVVVEEGDMIEKGSLLLRLDYE